MIPEFIDIRDFDYDLPESKIPNQPLANRDESKLLVYRNGEISQSVFKSIPDLLPANAHLVFNDTKVFPARLLFEKETGSKIEIFCLEPYSQVVSLANNCFQMTWRVLIGNLKRWKSGKLIKETDSIILKAALISKEADTCLVTFDWENENNFYQVLEKLAELPLPPYMNRKADDNDKMRYQTVYAQHTGSVAAPTAGLHFTPEVLKAINNKGIATSELTLHVGAGTFRPIKTSNAIQHEMHSERFSVQMETIENLIKNDLVIAVGTTSLRVLESLYWLGVKNHNNRGNIQFIINQWDAYELPSQLSAMEALASLLTKMKAENIMQLEGLTQIYILPGYNFKICQGIITNFHQPQSTLLLLVSAMIGKEWKKVYQYALENEFRFLSYGDSSLLFKSYC